MKCSIRLAAVGFSDDELWFNGSVPTLGREGFSRLRRARPGAVLQAPIDFLVPLVVAAPELSEDVLASMRDWGLTRFSLDWTTPGVLEPIERSLKKMAADQRVPGGADRMLFLSCVARVPARSGRGRR